MTTTTKLVRELQAGDRVIGVGPTVFDGPTTVTGRQTVDYGGRELVTGIIVHNSTYASVWPTSQRDARTAGVLA